MKLSIIIPVYNVEKYLVECIESIVNQYKDGIEVILIDDGSSDSSGMICDSYSKKYSYIKVLHKKNGGSTSARRAGCAIAQGEYILCVDSDDYLLQEALSIIMNDIILYRSDIYIYHYVQNEQLIQFGVLEGLLDEKKKKSLLKEFFYGPLNQEYIPFSLCIKVVKRDIFSYYQNRINKNLTLGEDALLSYLVLQEANRIFISNIGIYYYRKNEYSITNSFNKDKFFRLNELLKDMKCKDIEEHQIEYMAYNIFEHIVALLVHSVNTYGRFKETIINSYIFDNLWIYLLRYQKKEKKIVDKIKSFLIKNKYWRIYYYSIKIKEQIFIKKIR